MHDEILDEIERVVGRPVKPDDDLLRDLGLDSLTLTQLAVELEDRFQVRLDEMDAGRPHTIGEVIALIERRKRGA